MIDREKIEKLAAELNARHIARIELNGSEITDLCYLHGILTNWLAGKVETYDESRAKVAVDRLAAICERAIEAEEFN